MGNNKNNFFAETINNGSNSFLSELIINENKSFVSDLLRKEDMVAANVKQTSEIHTNENKGFISDQCGYPDLEAQIIQKRRKESRRKRTISQKFIFQRTKAVIKGSTMMN